MQFNSEKIITNFEPPISGKEYRQFTRKKKPAIRRRLYDAPFIGIFRIAHAESCDMKFHEISRGLPQNAALFKRE